MFQRFELRSTLEKDGSSYCDTVLYRFAEFAFSSCTHRHTLISVDILTELLVQVQGNVAVVEINGSLILI